MADWKTVLEAPEYEVSREGQIRSIYTNRPLKGGVCKDGYRKLVLCTAGTRIHRRIAALVCEAFHGPRPPGGVVRHIDGSRDNDAADNLVWGTQRENMTDKRRHGTHQAGERHGGAKLNENAVRLIRRSDASARDLAERFGVKPVTIYHVRQRRLWKHVK